MARTANSAMQQCTSCHQWTWHGTKPGAHLARQSRCCQRGPTWRCHRRRCRSCLRCRRRCRTNPQSCPRPGSPRPRLPCCPALPALMAAVLGWRWAARRQMRCMRAALHPLEARDGRGMIDDGLCRNPLLPARWSDDAVGARRRSAQGTPGLGPPPLPRPQLPHSFQPTALLPAGGCRRSGMQASQMVARARPASGHLRSPLPSQLRARTRVPSRRHHRRSHLAEREASLCPPPSRQAPHARSPGRRPLLWLPQVRRHLTGSRAACGWPALPERSSAVPPAAGLLHPVQPAAAAAAKAAPPAAVRPAAAPSAAAAAGPGPAPGPSSAPHLLPAAAHAGRLPLPVPAPPGTATQPGPAT